MAGYAADIRNFGNLYLDQECYMRSYQAFVNALGDSQHKIQWMESIFPDAVVNKLRVNVQDGEELKTLGSGEDETVVLSKLLTRYPRITNYVVEPADSQMNKYQDIVRKRADELEGVTFKWRKQGIEQFCKFRKESGETSKFHFISAIHVLYYLQDWEDYLRWSCSELEDGGILLIFITSDESSTVQLWKRFIPIDSQGLYNFIHSGHVRDVLLKEKMTFTNYRQTMSFTITDCVKEGNKLSENTELVFDFMMQTARFYETISPEVRKEFHEYLRGSVCSQQKDGRMVYNCDVDILVVTK